MLAPTSTRTVVGTTAKAPRDSLHQGARVPAGLGYRPSRRMSKPGNSPVGSSQIAST